MSNKSWYGSSSSTSLGSNGTTYIVNLAGSGFDDGPTGDGWPEASIGYYLPAGVLSLFTAHVSTNSNSGTTTIRTRSGGSNLNEVLSVAANTTGVFQDATNTDTISAGTQLTATLVPSAGGSFVATTITYQFAATGNAAVPAYSAGLEVTLSDTSTHYFGPGNGSQAQETTEANVQAYAFATATLSNLQIYVKRNDGTASTVKARKNGADGNQSVSVTSGGSGLFQDSTHTDSLTAADLWDYSVTNANGSTYRFANVGSLYTGGGSDFVAGMGDPSAGGNGSVGFYAPWGVRTSTLSTSDAGWRATAPFAVNVKGMSIYLKTNTTAGSSTSGMVKNGTLDNVQVSQPATTTGRFTDTSHTTALAANDTLSLQVGGGSTVVVGNFATYFAGNSDVTSNPGVGALVLAGFAPSASITVVSNPGLGTLTITGRAPSSTIVTVPGFDAMHITGYAPDAAVPSPLHTSTLGALALTRGSSVEHTSAFGGLSIAVNSVAEHTSAFGALSVAINSDKTRTTQMGLLVLAKGATPPPAPQPLPLLAGGRTKVINQRQVNMFYEPTPDGPAADARFSRGGLVSLAQRGAGPVKTMFRWQGFQFTVSGTNVFRDNTSIGTLPDSYSVRYATSDNEIVLVAGGNPYYVTTTNVSEFATPIPDPVIDVIQGGASGRFIYLTDKGQFYWSNVGDARTIDPLSFATADQKPENLIGGLNVNDFFVLFGQTHAEWWYATGDDTAPFDRTSGRKYDKGLAAIETLVQADNAGFFLGSDGIVYRMAGTPIRVSSYDVEDLIRRVPVAEWPNSWAFSVVLGGHTFYVLTMPGHWTWAFDISQQRWSEWTSFGQPNFRARVADGPYLGDQYTGNVMQLDPAVFQDLGQPLERVVSAFLPIRSGNQRNFNLALSTLRGVGSLACPNPVVEMRYSDQDGRIWSDWFQATMGVDGEYDDGSKAIWDQLGMMTAPGRLFEFRMTDNAEFTPFLAKFNELRP